MLITLSITVDSGHDLRVGQLVRRDIIENITNMRMSIPRAAPSPMKARLRGRTMALT